MTKMTIKTNKVCKQIARSLFLSHAYTHWMYQHFYLFNFHFTCIVHIFSFAVDSFISVDVIVFARKFIYIICTLNFFNRCNCLISHFSLSAWNAVMETGNAYRWRRLNLPYLKKKNVFLFLFLSKLFLFSFHSSVQFAAVTSTDCK